MTPILNAYMLILSCRDILCAVQDCKAPTPGVYIMIGEFSHPLHLNADGIQISTDGGRSWKVESWNEGIGARYGTHYFKPLILIYNITRSLYMKSNMVLSLDASNICGSILMVHI